MPDPRDTADAAAMRGVPRDVTVAIPVRNGGPRLAGVLRALAAQTVAHELIVCDSRSSDRSAEIAREHGARVIDVEPARFTHGGARNLLMDAAHGTHVALLTQDSEPADERWLERLLAGFQLADDVALVYGPYRPRPDASAAVRIELARWFASLSPDGRPQLQRLGEHERARPVIELLGRDGFFTDANACVARAAWQRVPFREVPYAEDRVLAVDMLRAGYAKAFMPDAATIHSHDYSALQQLRRGFDEWRGLREIYGWREPAAPAHLLRQLRGELAGARGELLARGATPAERRRALVDVSRHHVLARTGALLGSRADRLPSSVRRTLSLERRASFAPLDLDGEQSPRPTSPSHHASAP
jgi:rhamnosyltransferase